MAHEESDAFKRYLITQSSKVKHSVEGNVLRWDEDPTEYSETRLKSADFLDVMYSEGKSTRFVYMDRGTALDIIDKLKWSESKINSLSKRLKILYALTIAMTCLAVWGWIIK